MWKCPNCNRIFEKQGQMHSCHTKPLADHFKNKEPAKVIFDSLVKNIEQKIGKTEIISLPCCIHLFGKYDFLAALPKKDRLEIRYTLNRVIDNPRLKISVPLSGDSFKNCIDLESADDIDDELLDWIGQSYHLKD